MTFKTDLEKDVRAIFQSTWNGSLVWDEEVWKKRNNMKIYGSTAWCKLD